MAKMLMVTICLVVAYSGAAFAQFGNVPLTFDSSPRVITNFTSVIPANLVTSLTNLTNVGIGVGVFAVGAFVLAAVVALSVYYISAPGSALASILGGTKRSSNNQHYRTTRETGMPDYDLLTFLSVTSDLYERLRDYDEECQKQIICKTMEDPEIFGNSAHKVKYGLTFASSFLKYWGVPYVSEMAEAATLDPEDFRTCEERFSGCVEVSLKDTFMRSVEKVREDQLQARGFYNQ